GHLRQRPARRVAGDARGRGLPQDLHRQGPARSDLPGHAGAAGGGARGRRHPRPRGRRQGGRGHPLRPRRAPVPRARRRGARRGLAAPGPVPARRLRAADRPRGAPHPGGRRAGGRAGAELTVAGLAYPPDRASPRIADLRSSYGLVIDGDVVEPASGRSLACVNPATGQTLAEVAEADQRDVDAAVAAARRAQDRVWGRMPGRERARYMYRIAGIVEERARELAVLEALDTGTPVRRTRGVDRPQAAA